MKAIILLLVSFFVLISCNAQQSNVLVHSHNDYQHKEPFYGAYSQHAYSIEADVFAVDGKLLVGHDTSELSEGRTLEKLYILPIVEIFKANGGRAWKGSEQSFILLIDLKTAAGITLDKIVQTLAAYPNVFDRGINPNAVQAVISGNMPKPDGFKQYPSFIYFDGRITGHYTPGQLERIAFFSFPFSDYSKWKGPGPLPQDDKQRIAALIRKVHDMDKKVRFWASPDNEKGWETLHSLGVDIINTDQVKNCTEYFRSASAGE